MPFPDFHAPGETVHGPVPAPRKLPAPSVHILDVNAYARTQTDDAIGDGDVLVVPGVCVGVMCEAWPILVAGDGDAVGFHELSADAEVGSLGMEPYGRTFTYAYFPEGREGPRHEAVEYFPPRGGADYTASFDIARRIAAGSGI